MDVGTYTRTLLIDKQRDGSYAILLQSNLFDGATLGTSYVLLGTVSKNSEKVQLEDKTALRLE